MTEEEWLSFPGPYLMLERVKGTASKRQLRLFACNSCRRIWHLLPDNESRHAVEVAERLADSLVKKRVMAQAHAAVTSIITSTLPQPGSWDLESVAAYHARQATAWASDHGVAAWEASTDAVKARRAEAFAREPSGDNVTDFERQAQAGLIRDLFGNPFRPISINPARLLWNGCTIPKLAQVIYDERDLPAGTLDVGRLRVLADALEEAGCDDADVLGHLRGPGPHVRGCWVIDLILGKR